MNKMLNQNLISIIFLLTSSSSLFALRSESAYSSLISSEPTHKSSSVSKELEEQSVPVSRRRRNKGRVSKPATKQKVRVAAVKRKVASKKLSGIENVDMSVAAKAGVLISALHALTTVNRTPSEIEKKIAGTVGALISLGCFGTDNPLLGTLSGLITTGVLQKSNPLTTLAQTSQPSASPITPEQIVDGLFGLSGAGPLQAPNKAFKMTADLFKPQIEKYMAQLIRDNAVAFFAKFMNASSQAPART